jgi:hypothetical protein
MAVSSAAIASAVKIAKTAHRLRSGGRPSVMGASVGEVASIVPNILKKAGNRALHIDGMPSALHCPRCMRHMRDVEIR